MTFPCSNNEKKIKHVYFVNSIDGAIIEFFLPYQIHQIDSVLL